MARDADRKLQILIRNSFVKSLSILIAFFILLTFLPSSGLAQTTNDPWSEPVNVSHSGAATDPVMVVDATGTFHLIWLDKFSGPMYAKGDGNHWDSPVPVNLPFSSLDPGSQTPILFAPVLISDSSANIHSFWKDAKNKLFYSRVAAAGFATSQWNGSAILDDSSVDFSVAIDTEDHLHLSYIRTGDTPELPAGIYYRQSSDRGDTWSAPTLLYQSPYFRLLSEQDAHAQIVTTGIGDGQAVHIVWDNRPRGRAFWIESSDGGSGWGEPQEVGKAERSAGGAVPSNLTVYARGEKVLLLWQSGQSETGCTQYYQWSLDGGTTWQPQQRISASALGCPQTIQIMEDRDKPILMATSGQGNFTQVFLLAWDGTQWSDPQVQLPLSSFLDPETQQSVDFDYRQAHLTASLDLFVVGSEKGGEGDIWWLRRSMTDVQAWFPQDSAWLPVTSVTRQTSRFLSLALVADANGLVHVFWTQTNDTDLSKSDSAIYYTRWEAERLWSQPVAILSFSEAMADQPAIALDSSGNLLLVWRRGQEGEITFSRASANQAALPEAWSQPRVLSNPQQSASSPAITVDREGEIYVVYAVPINEGRGVYITRSRDGGQTWSEPELTFDAAAAGWDMLDQPHFTVADNGDLHLLWARYTLLAGRAMPRSLAYARSEDGGRTWSQPETVEENPVVWSAIASVGDRSVHRLWREQIGARQALWHERSLDNGQTWDRIAPISIFGEVIGSPSLVQDDTGKLHLLQVFSSGMGKYRIQHWSWDGERWRGSSLSFNLHTETSIDSLTSAISPLGQLAVILSGSIKMENPASQEYEIFFTEQSVELQGGLVTPLPPASMTPIITASPTIEPTTPLVPTQTPDLIALGAAGLGGNDGSSWRGLMIGGVLSGVIVILALGFGLKTLRSRNR